MAHHGNHTTEKVSFPSHGETLVGDLYRPSGDGPFPAVVTLGPYSFQKEQAPTQYATRLADEGFVALAFDPRTVGESSGEPRRLENPKMKNEDAVAAIDYVAARRDVDASRIYALGICQGGPELLDVASYDHRIKGVAAIAGYYRDRETDLSLIAASAIDDPRDLSSWPTPEQVEALLERRLAAAREAKATYDATGEVIYKPLVSPEAGTATHPSEAGLPGPYVWSWYGAWTLKNWENRYAVMSDLEHFSYTTAPGVATLQAPAIIIHSDNCMNPPAAKRHFESIPTPEKKLVWDTSTTAFQFYEQPDIVDRAVGHAADWFREHGA
ncbi:peptidase S15 [Mycobacteroides abscessus subsp. abscessus]|uniref:alpha/beta hydrolase n=1 Tax=Mycobacteroides abscessus TaxID=36809 RepID=UPI000929AC1A|nr:alpha/beta fold hydrolase [Mycobacteroides abscessus]SIL39699.1 peptidase S15 [Mycobacteroides abscessus subsp. abscessus]SLC85106.1 peptidase S15 [Mycobacteroides abscessus subsp. abscessus]